MTASTAVAPPLLEARALSFYRQDEPVFGPLDFCLLEGEVALVEGDNGSGKTTLLRILAGLLHIDEGSLDWRGQPWRRDEHLGDTLFLGHHLGLKADLSARENLAVAAGLYGARDSCTVDGVLLDVGLAGYEDEPVRRLSAGQKKRAALARLLLLPATLWLLDEPYANLDLDGINLVNRMVQAHLRDGGAALLTTHGAYAAPPVRTRMLELERPE